MSSHFLLRAGIYLNGLALGFVLMGFEMLGSRYLNPYFGSGIVTWAALISTVLLALMVGYFLGGWLVDRAPHLWVLSSLVIVASVYLFAVPGLADATIEKLIGAVGDGPTGVIWSAIALIFVPVTLLGTFSPFGVRLLLHRTTHSGRTTGTVYGVSTVGNIVGHDDHDLPPDPDHRQPRDHDALCRDRAGLRDRAVRAGPVEPQGRDLAGQASTSNNTSLVIPDVRRARKPQVFGLRALRSGIQVIRSSPRRWIPDSSVCQRNRRSRANRIPG